MSLPSIHIHLTPEDKPYRQNLVSLLGGRCAGDSSLSFEPVQTSMDALFKSQKNGHKDKLVITSSEKLLQLITGKEDASLTNPKGNFAGSVIDYMGYEHLFIAPLKQLRTVSYGKFLLKRYLQKFLEPDSFIQIPRFEWEIFDPAKLVLYRELLKRATFIAVDIENDFPSTNRCITCVGFSAVQLLATDNTLQVFTVVVPFTSEYNIEVIRQFCGVPAPKVLHNGKFDISYLLRFNIIIINYSLDTINLFHSWYSELPKRLYQVTAFCLRKWTYWKDESASQIGTYEYYQYNAKDCFTTAMSCLALLRDMPEFAEENYIQEFPTVFPCILAENTGIRINEDSRKELERHLKSKQAEYLAELRIMVDNKYYNPKSPQQTLRVWKALGSEDIESTDEQGQDKVKTRHPINRRIVDGISKLRCRY